MTKKFTYSVDEQDGFPVHGSGRAEANVEFPHALQDFYKGPSQVDTAIREWAPSMCRQEFRDECDINTIMARYETTGQLPVNMNGAPEPRYVDYSTAPDFLTAMQLMVDAEASFMTLPAKVRREFDNDPAQFVEFASNSENLEQMRTWGLAPPAELPDAIKEAPPVVVAPSSEPPPKPS